MHFKLFTLTSLYFLDYTWFNRRIVYRVNIINTGEIFNNLESIDNTRKWN